MDATIIKILSETGVGMFALSLLALFMLRVLAPIMRRQAEALERVTLAIEAQSARNKQHDEVLDKIIVKLDALASNHQDYRRDLLEGFNKQLDAINRALAGQPVVKRKTFFERFFG